MRKELRGKGLHSHDIGANVGKQIVGNIGLQGSALGHGSVQDCLHGLLRYRRNGFLLGIAGLLYNARQVALLIDGYCRIGRNQRNDEYQHQIEDLLLEAADLDSSYNFHSMVKMSEKPVTSKISMMVWLTWTTFICPCLFMIFCPESRTRSPAEEM